MNTYTTNKVLSLILLLSIYLSNITTAQYTKIFDFAGNPDTGGPTGTLVSDGTFLYGMTQTGGANNMGAIFKIMPDGSNYLKLMDFDGTTTGDSPFGSLFFDGTFLYGMATNGKLGYGTIFKIMPDGTAFATILDFNFSNGTYPYGSLISDGTFLYGTTSGGGMNNEGTIFKIMPDGSGYVKLLDFSSTLGGSNPRGDLMYDGTFLYGMTAQGGASSFGTVFKIMPDGSGYATLLDFDGTTIGSIPYGGLVSDGVYLYGTTFGGGAYNSGTIFKIMPDGSNYLTLMEFDGAADGGFSYSGSLILDGSTLYGMTLGTGPTNFGTIFKIMSDGSNFATLLSFDGTTSGKHPYGSLISDGTFLYGMNSQGGANGLGTIFSYALPLDVSKIHLDAEIVIVPNPFSTQTILTADFSLENAALLVYNAQGQFVKQLDNLTGKTIAFDRGDLPSGLYFAQLIGDDKVISLSKIVVVDK